MSSTRREPAEGHRGRTPRLLAALLALAAIGASAGAASAASVTISPLAGTRDASARSQISFLGAAASDIHGIVVSGTRSGRHTGRLEPYASAAGVSFLPDHPFTEGEQVTVSATVGSTRLSSNFTVARHAAYRLTPAAWAAATAKPGTVQRLISEPSLAPPTVSVTVASPQASAGDIFLTANHGYGQGGEMIIDPSGNLVWFKPAAKGDAAMDLQLQRYEGKPVLVWWQGYIAKLGVGFGSDEVYDSSYRPVAEIRAGNGYMADLHDVQITPTGSAFITAYALVHADLSSAGGARDGYLQDALLQEIDIKTGLVMFEWHALGHIALSNSYSHPVSPTYPWDWFHLNSICLGPQGDVLISARNTWALYDVSMASGKVLWRLGGKKPSFKMGPGSGTAYQHDARFQPDGTITVFDNGAVPRAHSQSRVIRLRIDYKHRTVKLAGRYVHTPALLAGSQGDYEVLANGDAFVGWGSVPYFSEFDRQGRLVFDGHIPAPGQSYRAYKFPWSATPYYPPAVAVTTTANAGQQTVYASWNGATEVSSWQVLAGPDPAKLTPLAQAAKSGFETVIPVSSTASTFAVQALDAAGRVLGTSKAVVPVSPQAPAASASSHEAGLY